MLFCSPIHDALFSSLHYSILLFVPLSSLLHCFALLFTLFRFPFYIALLFDYFCILSTRFFTQLLFSSRCYYWCCYSLKNLVLPPCIPSCKSWGWPKVDSWPLVFFSVRFFFPLFSFFSCLLFLCFFFFLVVHG